MNNGVATFLVLVTLLGTPGGRGSAPWWPEVIGQKCLTMAEAFVGPPSRGHRWVSSNTPTLCHGKGWFAVDHQPKRRRLGACSPTAVREGRGVEGRGRREFIVSKASAAGESEGVRDLEEWEERCVRRLDVAVSEKRRACVVYRC